jgi:Lrp/AsnC family transcriptional regulator
VPTARSVARDFDPIDRRILACLQRDAGQSMDAIAERAGLSAAACWRRIKKLEADGVVVGRVALLSAPALGLPLTGFVSIRVTKHSQAWADRFAETVKALDHVVEFHRMTGDIDYLLKIVAPDLTGYDALYRRLIKIPGLKDVSASFSMDRIKETTELPLYTTL